MSVRVLAAFAVTGCVSGQCPPAPVTQTCHAAGGSDGGSHGGGYGEDMRDNGDE